MRAELCGPSVASPHEQVTAQASPATHLDQTAMDGDRVTVLPPHLWHKINAHIAKVQNDQLLDGLQTHFEISSPLKYRRSEFNSAAECAGFKKPAYRSKYFGIFHYVHEATEEEPELLLFFSPPHIPLEARNVYDDTAAPRVHHGQRGRSFSSYASTWIHVSSTGKARPSDARIDSLRTQLLQVVPSHGVKLSRSVNTLFDNHPISQIFARHPAIRNGMSVVERAEQRMAEKANLLTLLSEIEMTIPFEGDVQAWSVLSNSQRHEVIKRAVAKQNVIPPWNHEGSLRMPNEANEKVLTVMHYNHEMQNRPFHEGINQESDRVVHSHTLMSGSKPNVQIREHREFIIQHNISTTLRAVSSVLQTLPREEKMRIFSEQVDHVLITRQAIYDEISTGAAPL